MRGVAAAVEVARGPSYIWKVTILAALRTAERLFLAAALLTATRDIRGGVTLAAVLAALHLVRLAVATGLRSEVRVRVESAAGRAVLASDPLRPVPTEGDDPLAALVEGSDASSRLAAELVPDLAGEALAALILVAYLMLHASLTRSSAFAAALVVAGAVAVVVRRETAKRSERAWRAYLPAWRQLRLIVGARHELAASGRVSDAEAALDASLATWRREEDRFRLVAALLGGVPVLAAWGAIAMAAVTRLDAGVGFDGYGLEQAALFAGVAPPLIGVLRALQDVTKAERGFASLGHLIETSARASAETPSAAAHAPEGTREVRADGLRYIYPDAKDPALAAASFAWTRGRILAINGPNGSGKTTLLELLLALATPSAGSLTVDGTKLDAVDLVAWRRSIAYVAQVPYIDEDATVVDFVRLLAAEASDGEIRAALARVDVLPRLAAGGGDALAVRMRALSAGQTQRVVLARMLVQKSTLVLLDEPDANLDAAGLTLLAELLRELAADRLVALVAHSPALLALADDLVTLAPAASPL